MARQLVLSQDSTEGRIMAAALRLFGRRGFGAVGIREIALEAGVSTAALYHYVTNKEDLLVLLMVDRLGRIIKAARQACEGLELPEELLATLVRVHVVYHGLHPDGVVDEEIRSLSPSTRKRVVAMRDEYEQLWRDALERGSTGSAVFDIPETRLACLALLEMCNGVAIWYSPRGELSIEQVADAYADLALSMVRATRSGRPVRFGDLNLPPIKQVSRLVATAFEV